MPPRQGPPASCSAQMGPALGGPVRALGLVSQGGGPWWRGSVVGGGGISGNPHAFLEANRSDCRAGGSAISGWQDASGYSLPGAAAAGWGLQVSGVRRWEEGRCGLWALETDFSPAVLPSKSPLYRPSSTPAWS